MPNLNLPSCFCAHFPPLGCLPLLREFGFIVFASSVQAAVGIGCCPSNLDPAGRQDEESLAALKRWSDTAGEGNIGTTLNYKVSHRLLWASFCPGTCPSNRSPCPFTTVFIRTSKMMKVDQMATTAILNNTWRTPQNSASKVIRLTKTFSSLSFLSADSLPTLWPSCLLKSLSCVELASFCC